MSPSGKPPGLWVLISLSVKWGCTRAVPLYPTSRSPRSARGNEVIFLEDLALLSENATLKYKKNVSGLRVHLFLLLFFSPPKYSEQSKPELACTALSTHGMRNVYLRRTRQSVVRTKEGIQGK